MTIGKKLTELGDEMGLDGRVSREKVLVDDLFKLIDASSFFKNVLGALSELILQRESVGERFSSQEESGGFGSGQLKQLGHLVESVGGLVQQRSSSGSERQQMEVQVGVVRIERVAGRGVLNVFLKGVAQSNLLARGRQGDGQVQLLDQDGGRQAAFADAHVVAAAIGHGMGDLGIEQHPGIAVGQTHVGSTNRVE